MKATDHFKRTIQAYLDNRAAEDELFAVSYRKEGKNIDDCITYILNYVKNSGCAGFSDGEIYSQAVHYFDEDNIDIGKPLNCHIAVNHVVQLTDEEKAEARRQAIEQYQREQFAKMRSHSERTKKMENKVVQPSLFDFLTLRQYRNMEAMDLNEARIYVGTYAKYNNGTLQGEWVSLSDFYDLDGFLEYCAEIHEDEEEPEYMFQDWENIPDSLIDESNLEENFFELRDELDRLNDTEKEAFWTWAEGNNIKLTQDAYDLVKSFQSAYIGSYASKEEFAEELVRMENDLSDFALSYFDFSKYADDLFDTDYWYKNGYVFRNE